MSDHEETRTNNDENEDNQEIEKLAEPNVANKDQDESIAIDSNANLQYDDDETKTEENINLCNTIKSIVVDNTSESIEENVGELVPITEKQSVEDINDNIPFNELHKRKMFADLMKEAEKRSQLLKSKILSQLNEVFKMFDINHDGIIDENDLKFTFTSLGDLNVPDETIKNMINESSKPIDFNAFVNLFESKEMLFDSEMNLIKAFSKWDYKSNGFLHEENLRSDLQSWGDRFSEKDTDYALEVAPIYEENGELVIDYIEFCANICGLQNITESDYFREKYLNK